MSFRYGKVFKCWLFNRLIIGSRDIELNEQILANPVHITKHRGYDLLKQWLGDGVLLSDGKKWHIRRKIITPTFHFTLLEEFLKVFNQQSDILLDCLRAKADGTTAFDVYPFVRLAALDMIAGLVV